MIDDHPVAHVRWVPISQVSSNNYNPNSVARNEMRLLYLSIKHDGYTQPIVTVQAEPDRYVVIDGFHRYLVMKSYRDIYDSTGGLLPIVVLDKPLADRMASTVRHNRARGKHSVTGMANIVLAMLDEGLSDAHICAELGLEPDELVRLKHVTGFSKLFENVEYRQAWETRRQLQIRRAYQAAHPELANEPR